MALGVWLLAGCQTGRVVYDHNDIRLRIEPDPTVSGDVFNNHPATLTASEVASLLSVIQVSGWSGTVLGALVPPRPVPLFTPRELATIADPLSIAFQEATAGERVAFSLPKPDVTYSEDRTEGALFLRGRYLHVVVTDHSSILRANTAGGDVKDPRDTKGMKLWVAGPAQAAMVPDAEEPRWAPFETVHVSVNVKEVLALAVTRGAGARAAIEDATPPPPPDAKTTAPSQEELQLQVRELTKSNLDLRGRLEEQNKKVQELTDQLNALQAEIDKAKKKPSARPPASPKP